MMLKKSPYLAALLLPLLSACQALQPPMAAQNTQAELEKMQQPLAEKPTLAVPDAVQQELLTALPALAPDLQLPRFNVSAANVELSEFFASLVIDSEFSVVVHPAIQGNISLHLKQVTLPQVMEVVQQLYGFDIRRDGQLFQVHPAGLRTETIAVNYLLLQRVGLSSIAVNSGGVSQDNQQSGNQGRNGLNGQSNLQANQGNNQNNGQQQHQQQFNGSTIQSSSSTDFWKDLEKTVQGILGQGEQRTVVVSPQAGLVTVRGMPDEIAAVRNFLQVSEQHLQRQVVLEAKIIEVTLSDDYQQGINWQNVLTNIDSTAIQISNTAGNFGNALSNQLGGLTSIAFQNAEFAGVISLLETQGDAQVLSSPRVTAINNQKAVIKVGQDEYFVTNVSNTTNTASNGLQNSTPSVSLQPFFSGIALDVTPQIDQNGQVILHVHPSVTETSEQTKIIQLSDEKIILPLAQSNIRESDTIIRARNGEIVVIGGLMQTVISDSVSGVPGFSKIPVLGHLFTSKTKTEKKKELVILLKPTVVDPGVWQQQIQQSSSQVQDWAQRRP